MLLATASNFAQYATDSIYYGSFCALISLSLSLLFGVMGLMNFAYGELIMAGAYVMYYTRSWGWRSGSGAPQPRVPDSAADGSLSGWQARQGTQLAASAASRVIDWTSSAPRNRMRMHPGRW